ncbi:uncharacterized protein JCM15063_000851 [Sporobolomyces koalae]|uniref:uncharacterized protein n=1 Tax=Sporobolomyces koalae TaxID=500713 RepID=UPI00316ED17A
MDTFRKVDKAIQVKQEAGVRGTATRWSNKDLDPVPVNHRTWSALNVVSYWNSDQFAPATWDLGSALVGYGLTLKQAVPVSFFAFLCIGVVLSLNGRIGALTHCSFPVCARAPFGMVGAYIPILTLSSLISGTKATDRVISLQQGGNVVAVMIGAIWPSFNRIENTLPEGLGITTQTLVGFLLLWLVQAPLACVPIHRIKVFFSIKAYVSIIAFFGFFVWSLVVTKGKGDIISGAMDSSKFPGGSRGWAIVCGFNSVVGLYSTVSVNISDFSRFSRSPKANHWQILAVPVTGTIPIAIAMMCAEAAKQNYDKAIFDPASLCALFDSRAARFFSSFAWVVMTIGVNLSANQLSFATDITSLMPRYVTILRGSILASILCWATCPWKIVTDAPSFLAFLGAYPVFLAPIATIMAVDFYIVRRGKVDVRELYEPQGLYWYQWGLNWRPFVAWVLALAPNLPAFAHAIDPKNPDIQPFTYRFSWLFSTATAALWYLMINYCFSPKSSLLDEAVYEVSETSIARDSEEGIESKDPKKDDHDRPQTEVVAVL